MNTLGDLKKFFESHKIKVTDFCGWSFTSKGDRWTMDGGIYYKNGTAVDEKVLINSFKVPKSKK
jgi:hypothetical protein